MKSSLYQISEEELVEFDLLYGAETKDNAYFLIKAKLELDEVLQHKYVVYKLLRAEIDNDCLELDAIKNRFKLLDRKGKRNRIYLRWSALAVIVCVLITMVLYSSKKTQQQHELLYSQYKYSESGLPILMASSAENNFNSAMIHLANKQFHVAARELKNCSKTDTTVYYLAYCKELGGDVNAALAQYTQLQVSTSKLIQDKSKFRRALLLMKLNNKSSIGLLQKVSSDPSNSYQPLATKILKSLNKTKVSTR